MSLIEQLPRFSEFVEDPTSVMWLQTAFLDKDSSVAERIVARDAIEEYWIDQWGYNFGDYFDWEGWREWVSPGGSV